MRKVLPRLAIPVLVATLLSACGIGSGPVISDQVAEKAAAGPVSSGGGPPMRRAVRISDPVDLVLAFLRASAGEDLKVIRSYIADGDSWTPRPGLKVVRIELPLQAPTVTVEGFTVNLSVQHIGILDDAGRLIPSMEGVKNYEFKVEQNEFILRDPPKDLLISESGLSDFYAARPIHFWSGSTLVEDQRYVSKALSLEAQSNLLVRWLYNIGPASWLTNSVAKLPPETQPGVTKVVRGEDNKLVIDLQAKVPDPEFRRLAEQLAKTLVVPPLSGLQIKVQGQVEIDNEQPRDDRVVGSPRRYAVVDGRVRRLTGSDTGTDLLPAEENKNLVAAAFAKDERAVAVVQQEGSSQRLKIGGRSALRTVEMPPMKSIAQPIWLDGGTQLLVLADHGVYQVGIDGKAELKLSQSGLTALSVAADGRGLALVVDGALQLASRGSDGSIILGIPYRIPTMFKSIQSAAFAGRGELIRSQLIVAGTGMDGRLSLMRMNIDGTDQRQLANPWQQGLTIGHLVADPYTGNAMFELQGEAYEVRQNGSVRLAEEMTLPTPGPNGKSKVSAPSFEGWL
ncbi:hypothetical protein Rhe02_51330 [Rhizocola hellebori]|uniref:GerMN domain-containing protein n=1 Tax=Rhizocola hellebori TaxID=1392758 RepID=A0A8J3QAP9_9ACTN|nr:hypothetical protein [Rhizocola hellebori]GIH07066.1 hypothetical protein Rhe02_51330 [Rhizocola hellebori]